MTSSRLMIAALLAGVIGSGSTGLLAAEPDAPKPAGPSRDVTGFFPGFTPYEQRIHSALDDQTAVNFVDTPLIDALRFLQRSHDINLVIDVPSLEDIGVSTKDPVNVELSGITLRSVLRILLSEYKADFVIRREALTVTSAERAEHWLTTRVYPVRDLVSGRGDSWGELVDAVQATAGTRWKSEDAPLGGTVASVSKTGCLVVSQNDHGHEAIVNLLNSLRRADEIDEIEAGMGRELSTDFVTFDRVVMNLRDPEVLKYLTMKIVLVVEPTRRREVEDLLERHRPRLKHQLATLVANRTVEDVAGTEGIDKLRTEIAAVFNQVMTGENDGPVNEVLFDEWHLD